MLDIKKAKKDLLEKGYTQLAVITAWTWASRAAAMFEFIDEHQNPTVGMLLTAEDFYHEALEHAAVVEPGGPELLKQVIDTLKPYREKTDKAKVSR